MTGKKDPAFYVNISTFQLYQLINQTTLNYISFDTMIHIEYPPYQPRIKKEDGRELIFDTIRRRWVSLTPEEWVRQNFLNYLIVIKKYPASLIAVEKEIRLGELSKRCDIIVYNKESKPFMVVECKEMNIPLDDKVLQQAQRYNISLQVPIVVITNGTYTMGFLYEDGKITELGSLPPAI